MDLPPVDVFKDRQIDQKTYRDRKHHSNDEEPINTQIDHSSEEGASVSDNRNACVQDSSSGDVSSSQQSKPVLPKRSCEGADSSTSDNSSPSETGGAGGSSGAVGQQQQTHDGSNRSAGEGQQNRDQASVVDNNPTVDMVPAVSYIKYSLMGISCSEPHILFNRFLTFSTQV